MSELEHEGQELARIHKRNNDKKYFCHFTGFLEGIAASGYVEIGEVESLIAESAEFVRITSDGDANDIIEDFHADMLEFAMISSAVDIRLEEIDTTCEKSRLNRFLGFCRGVVCDGIITLKEAQGIVDFLENSPELVLVSGVRQIYITCIDVIEDGVVTPEESGEICEVIGYIVGDCYSDTGLAQTTGVANLHEATLENLDSDLDGMVIVLTGNFKTRPRSLLEDRLAEFGASISRNVSGRTDYVIVGGDASRDWIELNRGTKIRMAQKLRLNCIGSDFI
jgi:NAD-dependent DNA ligase